MLLGERRNTFHTTGVWSLGRGSGVAKSGNEMGGFNSDLQSSDAHGERLSRYPIIY